MKRPRPLPTKFYLGDTVEVARALLGCVVWREIDGALLAGRIVETEAYLGANDPASHARRGLRSERNASMYLAGGHAYVYFTYGMHYCFNVVTAEEGIAEAVLIRALEPVAGVDRMKSNRPKAKNAFDYASGPGKLCMALGIDRELDGARLDSRPLSISSRDVAIESGDIVVTPRIGIDGAGDAAHWPLRFLIRGSLFVSASRGSRRI
jgi:DNA-3-methyladenine glycosylase